MHDVAVLGSGFAGTLLAMVARRRGLRVLLIERGSHPRFAIGESTSPLANLLLEELAVEYDLARLLPLCQYGTWKRSHPDLPVGLKRGFTYYHHRPGLPFGSDPDHRRQLLVAASPCDEVADTHWLRADFDHHLLREALALGAEYVDRTRVLRFEPGRLECEREGRAFRIRARLVLDATGVRGALWRLLDLPEARFPLLPPAEALYTHFSGVGLFSDIAADGARPPYPPDAAALHHVFEGGWIWVLRFDNGVTSAGIAAELRLARELRLAEGAGAWQRVLERFPSVRDQFAGAREIRPWVHAPRLAFSCPTCVGEGWAMAPSAAAFIDPFFSTGFPLALLGIRRLGAALRHFDDPLQLCRSLEAHRRATNAEARTAAMLVAGSYGLFGDFPSFAALSMLYFAAASFSEMAHRLNRADLASRFLLGNQAAFARPFRHFTRCGARGKPVGSEAVAEAVAPYNVAGLCDPGRRNWYPIDPGDAVRGAAKLGRTPTEVEDWIRRALPPGCF